MTRRFAVLAAIASFFGRAPRTSGSEPPPVQIFIGGNKEVTITIPFISRPQLVEIASEFLSRENAEVKAKLKRLFAESGELTFILTTKLNPIKESVK